MLSWFRRKTNMQPAWTSRQLANGWFTIVLPASWDSTAEDTYTTFDDPGGAASVGVIVSLRGGMTLADFAAVCFASKRAPLQATGDALPLSGDGWVEGVSQDFIDASEPEPRESMQRVACIRAADLYAKVTFYASESWLQGADYGRIASSIKLVGMRVVAGP